MIARNLVSPQCERDTDDVAAWIAQHGAEQGFRTPNTRERGRAIGMLAYLGELELGEQALYDAQGNSFDPQAVMLRLPTGRAHSSLALVAASGAGRLAIDWPARVTSPRA